MKYIDSNALDNVAGRRLAPGDRFCFACHPEISCFNRCCRNLNLFLYPYDAARLRRALGVDSEQFLDQYVDVVLRKDDVFPEVLLKMADNDQRTCPFLTEKGCGVYMDRPDTCRHFPLERGLFFDAAAPKSRIIHYFRPPDFCMGRHEKAEWTVETWQADQQARTHDQMTVAWAELRRQFLSNPFGPAGMAGPKGKMAFMAAYNPDRFTEFVFNTRFLKKHKVPSSVVKKIRKSDRELLLFAFDYIRLFLWGRPSKRVRFKT